MSLKVIRILLLSIACCCSISFWLIQKSDMGERKEASPTSSLPAGGHKLTFKGADFYVYKVDKDKEAIQLWLKDDQDQLFRNIGQLEKYLKQKGQKIAFAMNAGMYQKDRMPQGLYISKGEKLQALDTLSEGYGNFYLQPNGIFGFDTQGVEKTLRAAVLTRKEFVKAKPFENATQSGPMLVIDGKIHPKFRASSTSKYVRNGVGIDAAGDILFAFSEIPVNLYHFADLYADLLNCDNALYLDGAISQLYLPQLQRHDRTGNMGPLIGIAIPQ
ncbi:MAG: phosphodiester glycosidase family protein [Bacteroidota bacterium]